MREGEGRRKGSHLGPPTLPPPPPGPRSLWREWSLSSGSQAPDATEGGTWVSPREGLPRGPRRGGGGGGGAGPPPLFGPRPRPPDRVSPHFCRCVSTSLGRLRRRAAMTEGQLQESLTERLSVCTRPWGRAGAGPRCPRRAERGPLRTVSPRACCRGLVPALRLGGQCGVSPSRSSGSISSSGPDYVALAPYRVCAERMPPKR